MTENMDTFWLHLCEDRKVWTPRGKPCVICGLTEKEADKAWKKGTIWEDN